jgi:hypothetical protein
MDKCLENAYADLLSAIADGGSSDWEFLVNTMDEWNIDAYEMAEVARDMNKSIDFNGLAYALYYLHGEDVKDEIERILGIIDNNSVLIPYDFWIDINKLREYNIEIYTNYSDTSYDERLYFWDEPVESLFEDESVLEEIAEFLLEEGIFEFTDEECEGWTEEEKTEKLVELLKEYHD